MSRLYNWTFIKESPIRLRSTSIHFYESRVKFDGKWPIWNLIDELIHFPWKFGNGWLCHECASCLASHPKLSSAFFPDPLPSFWRNRSVGSPKRIEQWPSVEAGSLSFDEWDRTSLWTNLTPNAIFVLHPHRAFYLPTGGSRSFAAEKGPFRNTICFR